LKHKEVEPVILDPQVIAAPIPVVPSAKAVVPVFKVKTATKSVINPMRLHLKLLDLQKGHLFRTWSTSLDFTGQVLVERTRIRTTTLAQQ
jgi:hypothetical protein